MSMAFYYASGSPYAWRVWLALEHKQVPYDLKLLSFSADDLAKPEFVALNPRRKVPVIVDDGFALYESAAIVEYLEDRYPNSGRPLFPADVKQRAIARRLIREIDQYLAQALETIAGEILFKERDQWSEEAIRKGRKDFLAELSFWERHFSSDTTFARAADAVDLTLYPLVALAFRLERRKPDLALHSLAGSKLSAWMSRIEALPYFSKTLPPHWKTG